MKCTIEDIYEFNRLTGLIDSGEFTVNTRHGYKKIEAVDITAKNSKQIKIITENNLEIISSPDHLFFYNDWKKAKDFDRGDFIETKSGLDKIKEICELNERADLYDLQVSEVKEYYANEFVSHNSTIANAIIFGLYGQVEGFTLRDLPNRINKSLFVRIKLESKGHNIVIERGLAPKHFYIEVDGKEMDQAGKSNIQEYLEEEVFEIPYKVFRNIIVLSIDDFKSFITMTPKNKRLIIDKLFGFSVINDMHSLIREEHRNLIKDVDNIESELRQLIHSIQSTETKLSELKLNSDKETKAKIEEYKQRLIKLKSDYDKLDKVKSTLDNKLSKLKSNITEQQSNHRLESSMISESRKKLKLYESHNCPECHKPLDTDFDNERKAKLEEDLESATERFKILNNSISKLNSEKDEISGKIERVNTKYYEILNNIKHLKNQLVEVAEFAKKGEPSIKQFKSLLKEFKDKEDTKSTEVEGLRNEEEFMNIIEEMLGENGIKNMAIKTILPGLNNNIAIMSNKMHLTFQIRFDENFDAIINHLGEDINPKTLSTGERKKADFIVIIALIKLLKLRFPTLNLLFLDEIFSSIDHDGVYTILKILSDVIKEEKLNVFVINHTILPNEIFDKKITIYKDNGFSNFEVENIV